MFDAGKTHRRKASSARPTGSGAVGRDASRSPRPPFAAFLLIAAVGLLLSLAAPASVLAFAPQRSLQETFGSASKPSFTNAAGMSVDPASGDLYVIDLADQTLHRYNPDGTPHNFSALSGNVIDGHAGEADATPSGEILLSFGVTVEAEVAIAPPGAAGGTAGDIYVTNPLNGVIDVFSSSGAFIAEKAIPSFPCGVAVDPAGNVFVGSFEGANAGITKLIPSAPGTFTESPAGPYPLVSACQVAAGEGFVYGGEYTGHIHKFVSAGGEEGTEKYEIATEEIGPLAIDPESGRLLVPTSTGGSQIDEYIVAGKKEAALASKVILASFPQGVAVNGASGELFTTREGASGVEVFSPLPQRSLQETFGSASKPSFTNAAGMSVDPASGDLYVIDLADQTLHRYNPDGTPHNFSALSGNVIDGHAGEADATPSGEILLSFGVTVEAEVAIAPPGAAGGTAGDIYVTNPLNGVIDVFSSSGAFIAEKAIPSFPCGVAVDPAGNVFVGSFEGANAGITKLIPSAPGTFTESPAGPYPLVSACQVAAGEGFVYGGEYTGHIHKFVSAGGEEGTEKYEIATEEIGPLAIDPESGRLLVPTSTGGSQIDEYIVAGKKEAALASKVILASFPQGVAVNGASGELFTTREGASGVEVFGFGKPLRLLTITTVGEGEVKCKVEGGPEEACEAEYEEGTEVQLVPIPKPHWKFAGWSEGAGSATVCTGTTSCGPFELLADSSVKATFVPITHTFTVTQAGTGTATVQCKEDAGPFSAIRCSEPFNEHHLLTVKVTPAPHSAFKEFRSGTGSATACNGVTALECAFTIEADSALTAETNKITHTMEGLTDGTGTGSIACRFGAGTFGFCGGPHNEGELVTVKATEAADSGFVEFHGATGSASPLCEGSVAKECSFTLEANSSLTATFDQNVRTIAATIAGTGSGTVECKVGAGPFGSCSGSIGQGSQVTVRASAALHSAFAGFSAASGSASGCASSPCVFTLEANSALTANFAKVFHTLALSASGTGSGTLSCNGAPCASSYEEGTVVNLAASAAAGSAFSGWSGACSGTGPCSVTLSADTTVGAAFALLLAEPKCVVPKLAKKSLAKARSSLKAANCAVGKVTKPKKGGGMFVVKSSSPAAGKTLPANSKVNLKLAPKSKRK